MQVKEIKSKKIILLFLAVFISFGISILAYSVYADDPEYITTTVTVTSAAPTFSVEPYEQDDDTLNPSSTVTPTNVGDSVIFHATGDDPDGEQYYLAVCKENSITANNNGTPTCGGLGEWCVSTATNDETPTSCEYTAQNTDSEENIWYAFICDHSASSQCSSSSQGSGESGSPFVVNRRPVFTTLAIPVTPQDPGSTFTFNATAYDDDVYGTTDDNLYLLVCDAPGVTQANPYSAPSCSDGNQLNLSEASLTNPSTTYVADLDPGVNVVYPDGTYIAYGYVYDQHNLLASAPQSESWTVNNVAPVISIDGFNTTTVTLTESTTSDLIASVTVTDANSCQDITIGGSVIVDFFGNWLDGDYQVDNDHPLCNSLEHSNPDKCYPAISCVVDNSTNSCAGISDNQVAYTCTVPVQYHAEATGIGAIDSNHINGNWYAYITATDDDGLYSIDSVTNLNVDLLIAFSAEDAINYGSISSGYSSLTNPTVSVTSTGNTKIDVEVGSTNQSGESYVPGDYLMCTDYPTCSGDNFHIDNQQYFTSAFSHGTGIVLREPADPDYPLKLALAVAKTHWTSSLQIGTKNIYWSLHVPVGTPVGNYSGSNTLIAVQADW